MFPSRIRALNSDRSEDTESSDKEPCMTKEALEQRAVSQYQAALQLEQKKKWTKAEKIFRDLLRSDVLSSEGGKTLRLTSTLEHLKYCILMNLGICLDKQDRYDKALKYYLKATKLDHTDLNLWFRIGKVAMKIPDLKLSLSAFEECLQFNENHWPSIDNLVTVSFALGDYMSCLYYACKGISLDTFFIKGHAFKEKLFSRNPCLSEQFLLFHPKCLLPEKPLSLELETSAVERMFEEALNLQMKETEKQIYNDGLIFEPVRPDREINLGSWVDLAKFLLYLHQISEASSPRKIPFSKIKFHALNADVESPVSISDPGTEFESSESENNNDTNDEDQGKECIDNNIMEKLMNSQKRRSARVRSTVRREEPSLAQAFAKLIPTTLLPKNEKREGEDEMITMELYKLYLKDNKVESNKCLFEKRRDQFISDERYFNTETEKLDVYKFTQEAEQSNYSLCDAMCFFLLKLAAKWKMTWPSLLPKYYIKINLITLRYYPVALISGNESSSFYKDVNILLFGELLLNDWIGEGKSKGFPSPLDHSLLGGEFSSLNLGKLNRRAICTDDIEFIARSYWLESLLFLHCGDREAAVRALQQLLDDERCVGIHIDIPNVEYNAVIDQSITSNLLKALKRNKSLSQVLDLYTSGCYSEVTEILSDSLNVDPEIDSGSSDVMSRSMQYAIILDSYWRLGDFKECLNWSECCLYESLCQYRNTNDDEEREDYARVLVNILRSIVTLVGKNNYALFGTLLKDRLIRLIQTLSSIISLQMDAPDQSSEMPIESVFPWIILHLILKYDEDQSGNAVDLGDDEAESPRSLQLLFQGHDYLGRRKWCCFDEGALLFHTLDTIYPYLSTLPQESQIFSFLNEKVEQIFFCLYGIQKKNRGRHILDHNVLGLALTWNRAQQIFLFTRPRDLPSYDSVGKCCMSPDNETLYLKLIKLVPDDSNPGQLVEEMTKYIEGKNEEMPKNKCMLPYNIADIYFYLGHFYFKNKAWLKAWQYYLLDVCANPDRMTSWACLALSRGTEIETKLNSCETIKQELQLLTLASTVCRCYEEALTLDPNQNTLWIESGTFSYTIHSFCSNVLKKAQNLSIEMYSVLECQKEKMLNAAYNCFRSANKLWYAFKSDIQDERWLHHYMFGKISRKKDEDPNIYITHYMKSAALLHEIGATYPSFITYNSPQFLAVEALELFYRVHACILKVIAESDDKSLPSSTIEIFKRNVSLLANSPFVVQVKDYVKIEKPKKIVKRSNSSSDEALSADVSDIIQDIMKTESSCNPLKRKLSAEDDEEKSGKTEIPAKVIKTEEPSNEIIPASCVKMSSGERSTGSNSSGHKKSSTSSSSSSSSSSSTSSSSSSSSSSDSSSGSSSSSSSSSTDSSSSSSSDSDSDSDTDPKDTNQNSSPNPKPHSPADLVKDHEWLVQNCISALELCRQRFPEHYKSVYHLAHFYFKSNKYKDNNKVKDLLLSPTGLFAERRPTNFFNGIWRIPNSEIDRPGSFAAHMGRCVVLLIEFLSETKDYKMLIDLGLHLKILPEADKKFLRDNEREELCKEAVILCAQSIRKIIQDSESDNLKDLIIEIYHIRKRAIKSNIREPMLSTVLCEAYAKYSKRPESGSQGLENAIRFCQQQLMSERQFLTPQQPNVAAQVSPVSASTLSLPIPAVSSDNVPPVPQVNSSSVSGNAVRKPFTRRPRGRPPGSGLGSRMRNELGRGMNMSTFMSYQAELLRKYELQNAELSRQLAAANQANQANVVPVPAIPSNSSNATVNAASGSTTSVSTPPTVNPVLKDRPNLSIIPVKQSNSSKNLNCPLSVSVTKVGSKPPVSPGYKTKKQKPSQSWSIPNTGLSIQPITPSTSSNNVKITPISAQTKITASSSISISKTTNITPETPSPSTSTPVSPHKPEISLQHKILSAKKINISNVTKPKLAESNAEMSYGSGSMLLNLGVPNNSELSVRQVSLKSRPPFLPNVRPVSKDVVSSITIIPTPPKSDPGLSKLPPLKQTFDPQQQMKNLFNQSSRTEETPHSSTSAIDDLTMKSNKVPALDSNLADTLRNFGSSITITTASKRPQKIEEEMSIIPIENNQRKKLAAEEIIVLDD